jgi:hypothetical protein
MITAQGPPPIPRETYEILFEFVQRARRDLFDDLALMVGIPHENLNQVWETLSDWPLP